MPHQVIKTFGLGAEIQIERPRIVLALGRYCPIEFA